MSTAQVDAALELAGEEFRVFPISAGRKSPPVKNWQQWATRDAEKIRAHWSAAPLDNIGIATGDGLLVLDVDGEAGARSLALLELTHGKLPDTCRVATPSGGVHYYFSGPDVSNSVGALGAGLDVRSRGGYVCAPGSKTEKGIYTVANAADPAPVPEWLLELCTKPREKKNTGEPVADAAPDVLERAREWLTLQPAAIEGEGGDAHTFKIACGLRDLGVSQAQAVELLAGEWNARCAPPWTLAELETKAANSYRYAQNEAGAASVSADDFPVAVQEMATATIERAAKRFKGASIHDFARRLGDGRGYVVKGLLERASYAVLYGDPGVGKSFLALDVGYHVAAGKPWMNRRVIGGPVLYLAFEGTGGMAKRAAALEHHYGSLAGVPLHIEPAHWNLTDSAQRKDFAARVAEIMAEDFGGKHPVLIVVDTLARAFRGDENSAADIGAFNASVGHLIDRTGACTLVIHHSGKNKSAGARGSSALLGAVDTELEAAAGELRATKQRDAETGAAIGFQLRPLLVGEDADGDDVMSCVVLPGAAGTRATWKPSGKAATVWSVLCDLSGPENGLVERGALLAEVRRRAYPTGGTPEATPRRTLDRALGAFLEHGLVEGPEGGPWRRTLKGG